MRLHVVSLAAASWFRLMLQAQPAGMLPEFDAASVKANHTGSDGAAMQLAKGSLTITNALLTKIMGAAFGISEDRDAHLLVGPDWMRSEKYDVIAKFPTSTSMDQVRLMLQSLLKERLGMKFHREIREVPAYALVVAKHGLKARAAAEDNSGGFRRRTGHLESRSATMTALADKLSQQADRPVVDRTEVRGSFEFMLDWAPNDGRAGRSFAFHSD
jgi:uncharacterized protein (TIGR03435 family)